MDTIKIPKHIAIIVDGNGRWATAQGKTRSEGHKAGFDRLEEIITYAIEKGVQVLSLYVFSTENFKREKKEVDYLMQLFKRNFKKVSAKLDKENVKVVFSGREKPLEDAIISMMREIEESTKDNTKAVVNFCLNYGGHAEIVDACKKVASEVKKGNIEIEDIEETLFAQYLYQNLPPVDLLIRTSGEQRLSNFLPWQLSYAEFYFPEVAFPDFNKDEFDLAVLKYNKRDRRFGGMHHDENKNC